MLGPFVPGAWRPDPAPRRGPVCPLPAGIRRGGGSSWDDEGGSLSLDGIDPFAERTPEGDPDGPSHHLDADSSLRGHLTFGRDGAEDRGLASGFSGGSGFGGSSSGGGGRWSGRGRWSGGGGKGGGNDERRSGGNGNGKRNDNGEGASGGDGKEPSGEDPFGLPFPMDGAEPAGTDHLELRMSVAKAGAAIIAVCSGATLVADALAEKAAAAGV